MLQTFTVTLRRNDGCFIKEIQKPSRYAAKRVAFRWEEMYGPGYFVEIDASD